MLTLPFSFLHFCIFDASALSSGNLFVCWSYYVYRREIESYYLIVTSVCKSRFLFNRISNCGIQTDSLMMVVVMMMMMIRIETCKSVIRGKKFCNQILRTCWLIKEEYVKNARWTQSQEFHDTQSQEFQDTQSQEYQDTQSQEFRDTQSQVLYMLWSFTATCCGSCIKRHHRANKVPNKYFIIAH